MKRLFISLMVLTFTVLGLTLSASAKEFRVSSAEELKAAIAEINSDDGEDSTIIFEADISSSAMGFTAKRNVVIDLNTFKFTQPTNTGGTAGSALHTDVEGANVTIINGSIDVNDVCFWPYAGKITAKNLDILSRMEELVWWGSNQGGDILLHGCTLKAESGIIMKSNNGCGNSNDGRIIQIDNCTITPNKSGDAYVTIPCPAEGSYVKDTAFPKGLTVDAWHRHMPNNELILTNITAPSLTSISGACYVKVINSSIDSITVSSDGNGDSKVTVVSAPTCSHSGSQAVYLKGAAAVTTELDIIEHTGDLSDCTVDVYCSDCGDVLIREAINTEHNKYIASLAYPLGFAKVGQKTEKCRDCDIYYKEYTVREIFTAKGYSSKDTSGFGTGFGVNLDELNEYQTVNNTVVHFGIVAFNPKFLIQEDKDNAEKGSFLSDGVVNASKAFLQVEMTQIYSTYNLLINGFTDELQDLELVLAGYAYENDNKNNTQLFQKRYSSTESTPMKNRVIKGNTTLHTITISTVCNPVTTGLKDTLNKFKYKEEEAN